MAQQHTPVRAALPTVLILSGSIPTGMFVASMVSFGPQFWVLVRMERGILSLRREDREKAQKNERGFLLSNSALKNLKTCQRLEICGFLFLSVSLLSIVCFIVDSKRLSFLKIQVINLFCGVHFAPLATREIYCR